MLYATKHILDLYQRDEFQPITVYGGLLGIGKSTYASKVLGEVYGILSSDLPKSEWKTDTKVKCDWEAVRENIVFHPSDFVNRCFEMMEAGERKPCMIWDDAGLWLAALDWYNPFIKAVAKYMNVARTNWATIIFTSPSPTHIIRAIRGMPEGINVKVVKQSSDKHNPQKYRRARGYRQWWLPDMKKSGVRIVWSDYFTAHMPTPFYQWYKPIRDRYAAIAIAIMKEELDKEKLDEKFLLKV